LNLWSIVDTAIRAPTDDVESHSVEVSVGAITIEPFAGGGLWRLSLPETLTPAAELSKIESPHRANREVGQWQEPVPSSSPPTSARHRSAK
jgi:hypothetical protein